MLNISSVNIKKVIFIIIITVLFIELLKIPMPKSENDPKKPEYIDILEKKKTKETKETKTKQYIELFTQIADIKNIKFASIEVSNDLFNNNPYLDNMNEINISARGLREDTYIDKYRKNSFDEVTDNEKEAFNWLVKHILSKLNKSKNKNNQHLETFIKKYIYKNKSGKYNTYIAKSAIWLENAMPHTHKNVVILTTSWYDDLKEKYEKNLLNSAMLNEGVTLVHELLHVHQRTFMKKFEKLYYKWGFIKAKYIHNIFEESRLNRCNPDGNDFKWIWNDKKTNKFYIFGAFFNSEKPNNLLDVSYMLKEVKRTDTNVFTYIDSNTDMKLTENENFRDFFGITNNHYHPNEIASQYLEHYYESLMGENPNIETYEGYKIFSKMIKHLL